MPDDLAVFFLAQDEQSAASVMLRLTNFLSAARESLDFALYDLRLGEPLLATLRATLAERAAAGVSIRICYDGDKPFHPNLAGGQDPAPPGTGALVQALGYPWRRIGGLKLMHQKFIVRDRVAVWTGSTNLTDDAFTIMENNVLEIVSATLAQAYARDFEELWEKENFEDTGDMQVPPVTLTFAGAPARVQVYFSPGCGLTIDAEIARRVRAAQRRVRICSLLINSGTLIGALGEVVRAGRVPVDGVFDRTQMEDVYRQWETVPSNRWKISALRELIVQADLVGKNSTPYTPTGRHDFMHNKILVIDDTVVTGSYNFSRSATLNAENILFITNVPLAEGYSAYIDHLRQKYRPPA